VSLAAFITVITRALSEAGIPFMLTGSLAAAFYGSPRATQDVDLVIESPPDNLLQLVDILLAEGLYVDRDAALEGLHTGGQFNAIDPSTGWKADLIFRRARPFSETEFGRRQSSKLFGVDIALATLEDLVIAKLEWSELGESDLQRRDIRELLEIAGDTIDQEYLDHWIAVLGLQQAWQQLTRAK
jgi:hypothetical protein